MGCGNGSCLAIPLAEIGFDVIGLDSEGPDAIEELAWPERPVLVLGSEGRGLRDRIRQSCDKLCRIATSGAASLNVSNSAAIALHLAVPVPGRTEYDDRP